MRTSRLSSILAIILIVTMVLSACGATPTATPVPPTATTVPPTKAPAAATAAPAAATAAPAAATAAPAAPTATKAPAAATAVPAPTAVPPAAPAATGKTMVIGAPTMPPNLNPFNIPGGQWMRMFRFTLGRLINLDENGGYLPDLATTWTVSANGLEYTFNLRKDVKWSDGTQLTAKDVATTFNKHCDKAVGSNLISILKTIEGCQDVFDGKATTASGVKAVDDYTFYLKTVSQNPGFLYNIPNVVIVPDSVFGKMAGKDVATSDFVLKGPTVVSGPFAVKSFVPNEWIEFVANPTCFLGAPKLAGIIEKKIPDQNTRRLAFEKGEVDYITDGLGADYERMMKLPGITAVAYGSTIQAIWLNYKTGLAGEKDPKTVVFNKKEFRQALAYAIDWDAFKNVATAGQPQLLKSRVCFWTNGISGLGAACDASLNPYKYDLAKAQALIKQAGWDASWEIDFAPYGLVPGPEWEAVQQMWTKAGLKVKLRGMDPATFIAEGYEKGNFDISVLGLGSNANMADFYFRFRVGNYYNSQTCASCYNLVRYANPEFDKLVTLANTSADPKVYEPAMLKMTQMWNDELPFIIYGQGIAYMMLGPKVDGKTVEIGNAYCWDNPQNWAMK